MKCWCDDKSFVLLLVVANEHLNNSYSTFVDGDGFYFRMLSSIPVPSLMRKRNIPKRMGKTRRMRKLKMRKMEILEMKKMRKKMILSRVTRQRWSIYRLVSYL